MVFQVFTHARCLGQVMAQRRLHMALAWYHNMHARLNGVHAWSHGMHAVYTQDYACLRLNRANVLFLYCTMLCMQGSMEYMYGAWVTMHE